MNNKITTEMWYEYRQSRDVNLKNKIILTYLYLVKYLADRLVIKLPSIISQEDLESYGIFGLMEAVEKFNPDLGVSFKTYAYSRIHGSMIDEVRKISWIPRNLLRNIQLLKANKEAMQKDGEKFTYKDLAETMGIKPSELYKIEGHMNKIFLRSLDETTALEDESLRLIETIQDIDSPDPLEILEREENRQYLTMAIGELPEKDRIILALYYHEGLTLKEIGKVLGVSESRVCQLHRRALGKLRKNLLESES